MPQSTDKMLTTSWLSLMAGDRADLGETIVRLAHLGAIEHRTTLAQGQANRLPHGEANGLANIATDQPARALLRGSSWDTEVSR